MNKDQIKDLALSNGFKLKQQPDGSLDLNQYVYQFAEVVAADLQRTIAVLEGQVKTLMAHPDSYQSGFNDGRSSVIVHVDRWKEWARNQVAGAVPKGNFVVPINISDGAIERLGIMDNGTHPFFVINDNDDVKALYTAMISASSNSK